MNASLLALWLVCGFGSVVFAAVSSVSWRVSVVCAATFGVMAWWAVQSFAPSAPFVGCIAALASGVMLVRPGDVRWAPVVAAVLAGMWVPVIVSLRLPVLVGLVIASTVPSCAAWLRRANPSFAPESMCEEALLLVLAIAVVVSAAPTVVDGWHAAANLKLQGPGAESASTVAVPAWAVTSTCAALLSGGFSSLWSRR